MLLSALWLGLAVAAASSFLLVAAQLAGRTAEAGRRAADEAAALSAAAAWAAHGIAARAGPVFEAAARGEAALFEHGGVRVRVTPRDAATLIDLNHADAPAIAQAIARAGAAPREAERLAAALVDFRDPDALSSVGGAEAEDYARAGLPGPRDGPLLDAGDAGQVIGMPPDIVPALRRIAMAGAAAPPPAAVTYGAVGGRLVRRGDVRGSAAPPRPAWVIELAPQGGGPARFVELR